MLGTVFRVVPLLSKWDTGGSVMHGVITTLPAARLCLQADQAAMADGGYAFFDGMHKSCSKCKQARLQRRLRRSPVSCASLHASQHLLFTAANGQA